jgi:hypothetical protein
MHSSENDIESPVFFSKCTIVLLEGYTSSVKKGGVEYSCIAVNTLA